MRIAIIGAGYMGSAHARAISKLRRLNAIPGLELTYIVDTNYTRAKYLAKELDAKPLKDVDSIPSGSIDYAVIATPTQSHYQVFTKLLDKDVGAYLIEKPFAKDFEEAEKFVSAVEEYDVWVNVGHVERFNPAVQVLHVLISQNKIGKIYSGSARRIGPFTERVKETDVIYDLAIHDIDNGLLIFRRLPEYVYAHTLTKIVSAVSDQALLLLGYADSYFNVEVSRVSYRRQRNLLLMGSHGTISLDYIGQRVEIIYAMNNEGGCCNPFSSIVINKKSSKPLLIEEYCSLKCIIKKKEPPVDVYQALLSMYICSKALESATLGKPVKIEEDNSWFNRGLRRLGKYMEMLENMGSSVNRLDELIDHRKSM